MSAEPEPDVNKISPLLMFRHHYLMNLFSAFSFILLIKCDCDAFTDSWYRQFIIIAFSFTVWILQLLNSDVNDGKLAQMLQKLPASVPNM